MDVKIKVLNVNILMEKKLENGFLGMEMETF